MKTYLFVRYLCCFGRALFAGTKTDIPIWDILATGVAVLFQNNQLKMTLERQTREYPSKGGGKPATRSVRYKTGSGGREKWTKFAML